VSLLIRAARFLPCADARFSGVTQFNASAVSNYNGMIVFFQHRFAGLGGGVVHASYTYGHAFDEASNGGWVAFTSGSSISPQDSSNLRGSYGPAEYDVRHSVNGSYVWEVPLKAIFRRHGSDALLKGWQVSVFARTGFPYTVFDIAEMSKLNQKNFFGAIYAVPVAPLGSIAPCGKGAAIPLAPNPCFPPQLLADEIIPNPGALFLQSGCETGFNRGTLGPSGLCSGPAVAFAQGAQSFPWTELLQQRFRRHEEHEDSPLGKCRFRYRFPVL
jgi:hypothetical protein